MKTEPPKWINDMGNHNKLPEPNKEVTVNEFIHKHSSYSPNNIEFRQIKMGERYQNTHIYWFDDRGIAIVWPGKWTLKGNDIVYTEPIRYFRLGCEHKYKELSIDECKKRNINHEGRCWHVDECSVCGRIEAYDSSD